MNVVCQRTIETYITDIPQTCCVECRVSLLILVAVVILEPQCTAYHKQCTVCTVAEEPCLARESSSEQSAGGRYIATVPGLEVCEKPTSMKSSEEAPAKPEVQRFLGRIIIVHCTAQQRRVSTISDQ